MGGMGKRYACSLACQPATPELYQQAFVRLAFGVDLLFYSFWRWFQHHSGTGKYVVKSDLAQLQVVPYKLGTSEFAFVHMEFFSM